jgi:hypothetical protein
LAPIFLSGRAREWAITMLDTAAGIAAQEWIEGPDSNIYFTLFYRGKGGKVIGMFTGRNMLSSARGVGSTAILVAAPEAREALEPLTLASVERAGFDGMGSAEYKWDDNHRRFVIVETTAGRTDWQEEIAALSRVNILVAAFRHEVGLPPIPDTENPSGRGPARSAMRFPSFLWLRWRECGAPECTGRTFGGRCRSYSCGIGDGIGAAQPHAQERVLLRPGIFHVGLD